MNKASVEKALDLAIAAHIELEQVALVRFRMVNDALEAGRGDRSNEIISNTSYGNTILVFGARELAEHLGIEPTVEKLGEEYSAEYTVSFEYKGFKVVSYHEEGDTYDRHARND